MFIVFSALSKGVGFIRKRLHRSRQSLLGGLTFIFTLAVILVPGIGYLRGPELDGYICEGVIWVRDAVENSLHQVVVIPGVVTVLMVILQIVAFGGFALVGAWLVGKVPSFIGFIVLSEYQRRRGHILSRYEILLVLTLPICVGVMIFSYQVISLYAWLMVLMSATWIRFSTDPVRMERMLDWGARVQGGVSDQPYEVVEQTAE